MKFVNEKPLDQIRLIQELRKVELHYPVLAYLFLIPGTGNNEKVYVPKEFARLGFQKGVPTLFLPAARAGYHGLFIECGAERGRLKTSKADFARELEEQGYLHLILTSWQVTYDEIIDYLNGDSINARNKVA